jgi:hypothetical protein
LAAAVARLRLVPRGEAILRGEGEAPSDERLTKREPEALEEPPSGEDSTYLTGLDLVERRGDSDEGCSQTSSYLWARRAARRSRSEACVAAGTAGLGGLLSSSSVNR